MFGFAGTIYGAIAAICGALFFLLALQLNRCTGADPGVAHRLFVFSIAYLFVLFAALLVDHGGDSCPSHACLACWPGTVGSVHGELLPGAVRSASSLVNPAWVRSNMRYSWLAVVLCRAAPRHSAAALKACSIRRAHCPRRTANPVQLAGIMLAIVIPTVLATLGVAFWFRASNERARYRPDFGIRAVSRCSSGRSRS